jgi:hypothetical protein
MSLDFRTLHARFRDDDQRRAAQDIVARRLADDRLQDECRYLLRFCWQLAMTYTEVTPAELAANVGPEKRVVLDALLAALVAGHSDVDAWIARCKATLALVEDRTYEANR